MNIIFIYFKTISLFYLLMAIVYSVSASPTSSIVLQLPPNNKAIETNSIENNAISNFSERQVCNGKW